MRILLTGGTGSFGRAFTARMLPVCEWLGIYSRDELKQSEMARAFPDDNIRFLIGDVRDCERLSRAMETADVVIHAAAMKQVPACEYNPAEAVKTNVIGAMNVIECAIDRGVERVVALSTDKAAAPVNLYGATKLCADKLFLAAEGPRGAHETRFTVVRYGNVFGSRGSVVPLFREQARTRGRITITDPRMTRFSITLERAVTCVQYALAGGRGGDMFVPKAPSYRITTLAEAVAPSVPVEYVGIRAGEKMHEELVTAADAPMALDCGDHFVIAPGLGDGTCEPYHSDTNTEWLSVADIRGMLP